MRSLKEKPERDRLYDDLYWELCVLQACALGAYFAAMNRYDSLDENMTCGLLHQFGRLPVF
jgi:HD-like signal output (HDOD) protein